MGVVWVVRFVFQLMLDISVAVDDVGKLDDDDGDDVARTKCVRKCRERCSVELKRHSRLVKKGQPQLRCATL